MILADFPPLGTPAREKGYAPYPYQLSVITEVMRKRKQHGLFLEVGAGKTICCLAYNETHPRIKNVLVFCRSDNIKTWRDEIKKWTKSKSISVTGTMGARVRKIEKYLERPHCRYLLINHDAVRHGVTIERGEKKDIKYKKENPVYDLLEAFATDFDYVIMDESVDLKNAIKPICWTVVIILSVWFTFGKVFPAIGSVFTIEPLN